MKHVVSWSGGKDSTATVILMHEHQNELLNKGDEVVILFSEVMFNKKKGISGHNPDNIKFIYEKKKVFEKWGFRVEILHSDKDYLDIFHHRLVRSPDPSRVGLVHGFVPSSICAVKRDCKLKPIKQWFTDNPGEVTEYVGIAVDEPKRLDSLHKRKNMVSLLEKYNYTEEEAKKLCIKYDMLLPQYLNASQKREGCWFCPNAKLCEHRAVKEQMPEAWAEYVALENTPNLAYSKWNPYTKETLHQRDEILSRGYKQITIFDFINVSSKASAKDYFKVKEMPGQITLFDYLDGTA